MRRLAGAATSIEQIFHEANRVYKCHREFSSLTLLSLLENLS